MSLKPIFQVSEFNEMINHLLARVGEVTVEGEISELNSSQNKWLFITLKDSSAVVQVFGVLFQLSNAHSLDVGMKVHVSGTARLHPKSGRFSLFAQKIVPAGSGSINQAYENLKHLLEEEGVFDASHKRQLPKYPQRIGLITAANSQAYKDFVKVARERLPSIKITHIPATVQGEHSVNSLLEAIHLANTHSFDLLVMTRGGGSMEDLLAFNDESVVRAVFGSKTPITCAIGHEGNITLAELAADMRASTPSNAAELVVPELSHINEMVLSNVKQIQIAIDEKMHTSNYRVLHYSTRLSKLVSRQIETIYVLIERLKQQMDAKLNQYLNLETRSQQKVRIALKTIQNNLNQNQHQYHLLSQSLGYLDHNNVLKRGFSIATDTSGKIISHVDQVKPGNQVDIQVSDGTIKTNVQLTTKKHG